ncbi:MAG: transcriptional repressor [Prevotella sp.]|nr:transcriptional repressor [Prevotella sp.]
MKENLKAAVMQQLSEYLELNNLRKTPERFAVLEAILSLPSFFSMAELGDSLENRNFHVSRTTLYNVLKLFQQLHFVFLHKLPNGTFYEATFGNENRCCQVCTVCGNITVVRSPLITKAVEETKLRRFRRDNFSLYIHGVCSTCQAKMTRMKKKNKKNNNNNKK